MDYDFLFCDLRKKGFGDRWCIVELYFSVLINETSKGFFKSTRGLRQGDLLSPFFFSLVADGSSVILKRVEVRPIEGCSVGDDLIMVSHLQFMDDTILFLKAERYNIKRMEMCLKNFQVISSLKVNLSKSCMVGIHIDDNRFSPLAQILGCNVGAWPINYLGMPLRGNPRAGTFKNLVVEKVSKKLVRWSRSYISLGGRITLIKAAFSNIHVYYMSLYKMSCKVVRDLERYQRDSLKKGGSQKKDQLVKWEVVVILVKPKKQGGLGSGCLKEKKIGITWKMAVEHGFKNRLIPSRIGRSNSESALGDLT